MIRISIYADNTQVDIILAPWMCIYYLIIYKLIYIYMCIIVVVDLLKHMIMCFIKP